MSMRQGRCTNFGNCDNADKRQIVPVPQGADFVCPNCKSTLTEYFPPTPKYRNLVIAVAVIAACFLLGLSIWKIFPWPHPNHDARLRLAGSNTVGDSLAPALAEAFLKEQGATEVRTVPGPNPQEKIVQGMLPGEKSTFRIAISAHGSATAFTTLAENNCDIGMASRRIKADEAAKLSSLGDMYSAGNEHVLGLDGIAVIVNASNRVSELSKDQIMRIFTGEISDWSQIGSTLGAIKIYARDDKSGTFDTFKSLVLGGKTLASGAQRYEDSNALSEAVAGDPNGIGFVGLPFVRSAKSIAVSEKGTRPLQPTRLTISTEDYPLSRRLYLYTPAVPRSKYAQKFVEFALSKRGQEVVGASGFIAQNVEPESQIVPDVAPVGYKQSTLNAKRLSLDFRFQTGKSNLDNKALADLDRVVALIADLKSTGEEILLFGFADSRGTPEVNNRLSLDRAKAVENQFIVRGLKPSVVRGFGSELPVATNDTDEGREKNRRVEIWMKR